MCGRYQSSTEEELMEIKEIIDDITIKISTEDYVFLNKEIFPSGKAPIITKNNEIIIGKWGFSKWDNKGVIFNTRKENADKSSFFKESLDNNRCVIPARCYFEWEHENSKGKDKYQISTFEKTIYMAGIMKIEGDQNVYSIITKDADEEINFIHHRMPVLLRKNEIKKWLSGEYELKDIKNNNLEIVFSKMSK